MSVSPSVVVRILFVLSLFGLFQRNSANAMEFEPAGYLQSRPAANGLPLFPPSDGKAARANPPACSDRYLEQLIRAQPASIGTEQETISDFFSRCDETISRFSKTKLGSLLDMTEHDYVITGRHDLSEVIFTLPFGVTLHGLLGLKPGKTARPMVVVLGGTSCNLGSVSARAMLSPLFDETPFNVLVLPSVSGSDFIALNHLLELGGVAEGRQMFEVIRQMVADGSPLRPLISSVHVMGVSLGGNGALFTSVYASMNELPSGGPKIQSVIGLSPAIDLKQDISDLDRTDIIGRTYRETIQRDTIGRLEALVGVAPTPEPELYSPGSGKAVDYVSQWLSPTVKTLLSRAEFLMTPFANTDLSDTDGFWKSNNFLNFTDKVTIPTLVISAKNDYVINPADNAQKLANQLSAPKPPSGSIAVFQSRSGWHVQFSEVYGDDIFMSILRGVILNHSPEFKQTTSTLPLASVPAAVPALSASGERYFGYRWKIKSGEASATLTFSVWTPQRTVAEVNNMACSSWSPYTAFEGCFSNTDVKIPLSNVGSETPDSDGAAAALTRWLNSHVKVLTSDGSEPIDTTSPPQVLSWNAD